MSTLFFLLYLSRCLEGRSWADVSTNILFAEDFCGEVVLVLCSVLKRKHCNSVWVMRAQARGGWHQNSDWARGYLTLLRGRDVTFFFGSYKSAFKWLPDNVSRPHSPPQLPKLPGANLQLLFLLFYAATTQDAVLAGYTWRRSDFSSDS